MTLRTPQPHEIPRGTRQKLKASSSSTMRQQREACPAKIHLTLVCGISGGRFRGKVLQCAAGAHEDETGLTEFIHMLSDEHDMRSSRPH